MISRLDLFICPVTSSVDQHYCPCETLSGYIDPRQREREREKETATEIIRSLSQIDWCLQLKEIMFLVFTWQDRIWQNMTEYVIHSLISFLTKMILYRTYVPKYISKVGSHGMRTSSQQLHLIKLHFLAMQWLRFFFYKYDENFYQKNL